MAYEVSYLHTNQLCQVLVDVSGLAVWKIWLALSGLTRSPAPKKFIPRPLPIGVVEQHPPYGAYLPGKAGATNIHGFLADCGFSEKKIFTFKTLGRQGPPLFFEGVCWKIEIHWKIPVSTLRCSCWSLPVTWVWNIGECRYLIYQCIHLYTVSQTLLTIVKIVFPGMVLLDIFQVFR